VPHAFHEVGERVVVEQTIHATGKSTGLEVEQPSAGVWAFKDSRAIGVEVYPTLEEAMEAARAAGDQS
jgi:hypothetical protein